MKSVLILFTIEIRTSRTGQLKIEFGEYSDSSWLNMHFYPHLKSLTKKLHCFIIFWLCVTTLRLNDLEIPLDFVKKKKKKERKKEKLFQI